MRIFLIHHYWKDYVVVVLLGVLRGCLEHCVLWRSTYERTVTSNYLNWSIESCCFRDVTTSLRWRRLSTISHNSRRGTRTWRESPCSRPSRRCGPASSSGCLPVADSSPRKFSKRWLSSTVSQSFSRFQIQLQGKKVVLRILGIDNIMKVWVLGWRGSKCHRRKGNICQWNIIWWCHNGRSHHRVLSVQ